MVKREQIRGGEFSRVAGRPYLVSNQHQQYMVKREIIKGEGLSSPGLGSEEKILRIMISNPQSLFSLRLELWNYVNVDNRACSMGAVFQATSQQCSRHMRDTGLAWQIGAKRGDR